MYVIHAYRYPWRSGKRPGSSRIRGAGGNVAEVLYKSCKDSNPLSHLSKHTACVNILNVSPLIIFKRSAFRATDDPIFLLEKIKKNQRLGQQKGNKLLTFWKYILSSWLLCTVCKLLHEDVVP